MTAEITSAFIGGSPGGGELILIFLVALLLFGSKNLPKMARNLGKAMEEFRRSAREVSDEIMKGEREAPRRTPLPPSINPPKEIPSDRPGKDQSS